MKVSRPRGNVVNSYTGTGANTYRRTSGVWKSFAIINDNLVNNINITVNGLNITVRARETFDDDFNEFSAITIHNGNYRVVLRE